MAGNEVGVDDPYSSMSSAAKAEEMVEQLIYLGSDFKGVIEDLEGAASTYVSSGLSQYQEDTAEGLSAVVESGINLASDVEGANLTIFDADYESADSIDQALEDLGGLSRPANG